MEGVIIWLILGAVAGWLGSMIWKGSGLGLIGNIIVGILGGMLGGWLFGSQLGWNFGGGMIGSIITAALGAFILLAILNLIMGRKRV